MRLTLRTLLAYLEDELKPSESKEIGQKIAESPVATSLAQRIREVMRRRRLSAEDLNETGLDPNLVAEYLDGSLTPQEVADVERVCLGSDAHLAEVAACHQILTLVLGEPIEISESSRERMFALADDGTVAKSDIPMPVTSSPAPVEQAEPTPFPAHLQRNSRWQSALPLLIPVVLIGMWVALIRFDPSLNFFAAAPGDGENGMTIAAADPDDIEENGQAPDFVPQQKQEPDTVSTSASPGDPEPGIDPPPPPDMPEPEVTVVESVEGKANPVVANSPTDEPAGNVPETPAAQPQPAVPVPPLPGKPAERKTVGRYRSTAGILLSFDETKRGWYPVPYELELLEQTSLVVPVPFSAILEMENEAPLLDLKGGTKAQLITNSQAADLGVRLHEGRVVLEALNPQPTSFACKTGTLDWRFELNESGTRVGIEMEPLQVYGAEQSLPENYFRLTVIVTSGAVRLASETSQVTLSEGQEIVLHDPTRSIQASADPSVPAVDFSVPGMLKPEMVHPYDLTPDWMKPESGIISTIQQMYIDEFATRFRPGLPAAESLEPLLEDPRPRMAQYTVICLGLIDHVQDLIKTMRVSQFEDARLAAASEVRLWLPRHPEQGEEYLSRLELSFPGDDADQLDRLLWGFSTDDARDPIASQSLIGLLDHDRPILSELAFLEMARLTGLEESYKALITPTQRRAWTNRWKRMVRDQGTILPAQADE